MCENETRSGPTVLFLIILSRLCHFIFVQGYSFLSSCLACAFSYLSNGTLPYHLVLPVPFHICPTVLFLIILSCLCHFIFVQRYYLVLPAPFPICPTVLFLIILSCICLCHFVFVQRYSFLSSSFHICPTVLFLIILSSLCLFILFTSLTFRSSTEGES